MPAEKRGQMEKCPEKVYFFLYTPFPRKYRTGQKK